MYGKSEIEEIEIEVPFIDEDIELIDTPGIASKKFQDKLIELS